MLDDAGTRLHLGRVSGGGAEGIAEAGQAAGFAAAPFDRAWGALQRQLWVVLLPVLLLPLLGAAALSRMPTLYTATGTVLYDPAVYGPDILQGVLKADPASDSLLASQAAILRSLSIAHRVAIGLDLAAAPGFAPRPGAAPAAAAAGLDAAVLRAITVSPLDSPRVLAVSFTARDPALAARAANRIMALYRADQLDAKTAALTAADSWMQSRADGLRRKLTAEDAAIARYSAAHGLIAGVQARIGTEEVSALGGELMKAENDLASARARRMVATTRGGNSLPDNLVALRLAEAEAAGKLDAALAHLGPNHPEVRALRDQLASLRAAAGSEMAAVQSGVAGDADAAAARLQALQRALGGLQSQAAEQAAAEGPLTVMRQDADATRALLQALLTRMDQTAQQAAIQSPDARILSEAEPPSAPSSPKTHLLLAAAALAGLVLGIGLAWAREAGGLGFRTEGEVRGVLGLAGLGAVPHWRRPPWWRRMRQGPGFAPRRRRRQSPAAIAEALAADGAAGALALGLLRGRMRQGLGDPRIVTVTSARPGEGKSTLTLALALRAAREGERVLVIDGDRARPKLSRMLGAEREMGLAEFLCEAAPGAALLRRHAASGVDYLPASAGDGAMPSILRLAAAMGREGWRRDYDLILIDAPPLLASADALALSEMADAVLLCLRWRRTPRRLALHARALLARPGARGIGCVLTRVDAGARAVKGFPEADLAAAYSAYRPR
ncbi:GumC family protein [Acidisoma sp. C75]